MISVPAICFSLLQGSVFLHNIFFQDWYAVQYRRDNERTDKGDRQYQKCCDQRLECQRIQSKFLIQRLDNQRMNQIHSEAALRHINHSPAQSLLRIPSGHPVLAKHKYSRGHQENVHRTVPEKR